MERTIKLFEQGMSYSAIAKEMGLHRNKVTRYLKKQGFEREVPEKVLEANARTAEVLSRDYAYTCLNCGRDYVPKAKDRTMFCSRECSFEAKKAKPKPPKPKKTKPVKSCIICGVEFKSHTGKCCSDDCRKERERIRSSEYGDQKKDAEYTCKECGLRFKPSYGDKRRVYCGDDCVKKARKKTEGFKAQRKRNNRARRARLKGAKRTPYNDKDIFERDKWVCGICGKRVGKSLKYPHPMCATIDHIIPLSQKGADAPSNVQLAHFKCNSIKSDNSVMPNDKGQMMIV